MSEPKTVTAHILFDPFDPFDPLDPLNQARPWFIPNKELAQT